MLFRSITAAAVLAVAAHASSNPAEVRLSSRELFGFIAPRDEQGYTPSQTFCGMGATCAEACGSGFQMCPSTDNSIHCYNPTVAQVCCPGGAGMSCDPGYFCAGSVAGEQLCCKEGTSLESCASAKNVKGPLTSQAPVPATTSTTSTSSSSTSTSSTSIKTTSSSVVVSNNTAVSTTSSSVAKTTAPTALNNSTSKVTTPASPSSDTTPSNVAVPGGATSSVALPAGAMMGLAAAVFAAALL